jgi:outer membrane immunogenic protein
MAVAEQVHWGFQMKKLLLGGFAAISVLVGGPAVSADLPMKAAPAVVRPACANFGGFYIGGNVGWGYYDHRFNDRDGLGPFIDTGLPSSISATDSGINGGPQIGYNWQRGCTVFGFEADWSWTDLRASEIQLDGDQPPLPTDSVTVDSRLRWFGTARLRTGIVVDNLLLYVTGGFAYANFQRTWSFFEDGPATLGVFKSDRTRWGWTAGVGTEWQWAPNWSIKSEFLYMRFEKDHFTVAGDGVIGALGAAYRLDSDDSLWITRVGLNYRF